MHILLFFMHILVTYSLPLHFPLVFLYLNSSFILPHLHLLTLSLSYLFFYLFLSLSYLFLVFLILSFLYCLSYIVFLTCIFIHSHLYYLHFSYFSYLSLPYFLFILSHFLIFLFYSYLVLVKEKRENVQTFVSQILAPHKLPRHKSV